LQRAERGRDKRRNREFHGFRDDQWQRPRFILRTAKFPRRAAGGYRSDLSVYDFVSVLAGPEAEEAGETFGDHF
jgi:hypothetical protein